MSKWKQRHAEALSGLRRIARELPKPEQTEEANRFIDQAHDAAVESRGQTAAIVYQDRIVLDKTESQAVRYEAERLRSENGRLKGQLHDQFVIHQQTLNAIVARDVDALALYRMSDMDRSDYLYKLIDDLSPRKAWAKMDDCIIENGHEPIIKFSVAIINAVGAVISEQWLTMAKIIGLDCQDECQDAYGIFTTDMIDCFEDYSTRLARLFRDKQAA